MFDDLSLYMARTKALPKQRDQGGLFESNDVVGHIPKVRSNHYFL